MATANKETSKTADPGIMDPVALGKVLMEVAEKSQPILQKFLTDYEFDTDDSSIDPLHAREAYLKFLQHLMSNPQKLVEMQMQFWQDWMHLWQESAIRFMGGEGKELFKPEKGDRRFKAPIWQESALFDFIKQSYLLTSRSMENAITSAEGLDDATRQKIDFYTRQWVNALAPSNFLLTNPEVLKETIDTKGENLIRGLENLLEDIERGRISTTDYDAFELGKNLATSPGKVIYQNDLMQLIQYEPTTKTVFQRPLLIVPPWINKCYILDLRPDKQVKKVTGEPDVNIIGYCLGGTLMAITLAWLAAKKKAGHIASATFLTTLIDFERSGDMKLFMDDAQIDVMEKSMAERGFLDAGHLRKTFSLLRSNDMIWSFVVNNYLMGKEPFPFDLLYWNDDATNMPAAMHSFYLRKLYRDNLLVKPGGVVMNGVDIDMTKVETPCYFLSTKEDHIAPWQATYAGTQLLKGPCVFTLAASGHVAGVINPPEKHKYCYWSAPKNPPTPYEWLDQSKCHDGSWWPHWQKWVAKYTGDKVPARQIGGGKLEPIEDAPGSYVKMKSG